MAKQSAEATKQVADQLIASTSVGTVALNMRHWPAELDQVSIISRDGRLLMRVAGALSTRGNRLRRCPQAMLTLRRYF